MLTKILVAATCLGSVCLFLYAQQSEANTLDEVLSQYNAVRRGLTTEEGVVWADRLLIAARTNPQSPRAVSALLIAQSHYQRAVDPDKSIEACQLGVFVSQNLDDRLLFQTEMLLATNDKSVLTEVDRRDWEASIRLMREVMANANQAADSLQPFVKRRVLYSLGRTLECIKYVRSRQALDMVPDVLSLYDRMGIDMSNGMLNAWSPETIRLFGAKAAAVVRDIDAVTEYLAQACPIDGSTDPVAAFNAVTMLLPDQERRFVLIRLAQDRRAKDMLPVIYLSLARISAWSEDPQGFRHQLRLMAESLKEPLTPKMREGVMDWITGSFRREVAGISASSEIRSALLRDLDAVVSQLPPVSDGGKAAAAEPKVRRGPERATSQPSSQPTSRPSSQPTESRPDTQPQTRPAKLGR